MLSHRLQVLLDEDRHARISDEAKRRGVSVALVVREAIDRSYPSHASARGEALAAILAAAPMPVPDPDDLRVELDEIRARTR